MFREKCEKMIVILMIGVATTIPHVGNAENCVPRDFGYGSVVCVCNSTYCDSAARNVPEVGRYRSYESNKDGKRMSEKIGMFERDTNYENDVNPVTITLNPDQKFQKIHGFGGAFTDSAGINIGRMSKGSQNRIFETYFGVNGSRYNLGRVPIGGTDFSTRGYTYDDERDERLEKFSLAREDLQYKIPMMKRALAINPELKFVSAAWTAPPWTKTNNYYYGFGFLRKKYYQTYADYLLKFLIEYKKRGLKIWAISTGNEPNNAFIPFFRINTMGWTPATVGNWIADNLGPTIAASESNDTIILIIDDQRINLPWYVVDIFKNSRAKNYTAGIALHWYWDSLVSPKVLDATNDLFPEKFLILTEASVGSLPWDIPKVRLGDWNRGEMYVSNILENLNHWMTGWIDWNLALDKNGGPNWVENFVDSPIIVNPETDEFFKQPLYYALAHFSKFITRGSTRIGTTNIRRLKHVAFLTPDNEIVIVLYNSDYEKKVIVVKDPQRGYITTSMSPYSIQTIIYKK